MRVIKVLQICASLGMGGIEKLLTQWYEQAKVENIDFEFVTFEKRGSSYDYFIDQGCKINVFKPLREVGYIKYFIQFNNLFKNNKYDIVHCPASPAAFIILGCAKLNGVKNRFLHAHVRIYF